jgi:predicted alpha-1,2-mannosidase
MLVSRTRGVVAAVVAAVLVVPPGPPAAAAAPALITDPVRYVDPFIGSARGGNTWPGATRPFGMIAWSPTSTTGDQTSTGAANGYEYGVTRVRGFSLTHVNGAGCHPGAAGDVPIMPFVGDVTTSPSADTTDAVYASGFSHADESASPGRYSVTLDSGARTDLAVSTRAGVGEFTFPAGSRANLLFRTSNSLNGSEDAEITIDPGTRTVTGSVLTGGFCGRRGNGGGAANPNRRSYYRLFFSAVFDRDFARTGTWRDATVDPGGLTATGGEGYLTGAARAGRGSGGWVGFDAAADPDVRMKIGISYVDPAGAVRNRDAELPADATVASVAAATRRAWNEELGRIRVGGGTEARRTAFYTGVYHALMQPQTVSDVDGRYLGADLAVHTVTARQNAQLGTFSGWDQYRAQIQLLALLRPDVAGDLAQSMLAFARQNGGVWDRWLHLGAPTHVMTGDPAAPTLATFAAMGVTNFAAEAAFESLLKQATVPNGDAANTAGCPGQCVAQRAQLGTYLALRYAPHDGCACWGGAAETLENSLADHALAMWARRLGRDADAAPLLERGGDWRNTFNPQATGHGGYQQARNADGSWAGGFSPATDVGFAQGSSATYTWMVPQDVGGLGELMGGGHVAVERLDRFFRDENGAWAVGGGSPVRYDPTNEPGIHIPWMYNGLGQPWKTQEVVRRIADTVYGTGPSGLPGNDDLGTMSAWYVFAAMGLFPQTPGRAELLVGSPMFPRIEVRRSNGVRLRVNAASTADTDAFVQRLALDGRTRTRSWLPESFVRGGGVVTFTLGPKPRIGWATAPADLPEDHVGR